MQSENATEPYEDPLWRRVEAVKRGVEVVDPALPEVGVVVRARVPDVGPVPEPRYQPEVGPAEAAPADQGLRGAQGTGLAQSGPLWQLDCKSLVES